MNKNEKIGRDHRAKGGSRSSLPGNKWFLDDKGKQALVDQQRGWDMENKRRENSVKKR